VLHVLAIVVGIGIVDSLNPSTIAPALYLAAGRDAARGLAGFIGGVFAANLVLGLLLALGPGQAIMSRVPHPGDEARHLIELTAGGLLVVLAGALWVRRDRVAHHVTANTERIDRSSAVLGAAIAVAEFPTAIPYFAVIAAVVDSGKAVPVQVGLLVIFNLCFVLPLLGVLVVRTVAGERSRLWLERARANIDRWLATLVPGLVFAVGFVLVVIGAYGLVTDRS
jgi:hypothetical protein